MKNELKLCAYVVGLYICFVSWGYLQEKITSTEYSSDHDSTLLLRFKFPFILNFLMALSASIVAAAAEFILRPVILHPIPFLAYMKPAATCALASPIGYTALEFINFPLMILTKASKPVPVMLIGILFYNQKYTLSKYLSVLLICGGIILFSAFKSKSESKARNLLEELFGISLIIVNLFLDGYTNNQQDFLFRKYQTPSETMMKNVNFFQAIYLGSYVLLSHLIFPTSSELTGFITLLEHSSRVRLDILLFCIMASLGQLLIFSLMKDFGSLVWVTVSALYYSHLTI